MNDTGAQDSELGKENTKVDPNVLAELPHGSRVISTEPHGSSFWADTGRINVELADGTPMSFFIKVLSDEIGKNMVCGEYESMKAIHDVTPGFAPRPIAWGTYRYASIDTCLIKRSDLNDWEESWEVFFTKSMKWPLELEIKARGSDPEFDVLVPVLFDKVIPRLLRPLESDGRSVKPSLVHRDVWHANSGIDAKTGQPFVFDACCFYAYNEYESCQWRPSCNLFGAEYFYNNKRSEPEEDYDGRLDL